MVSNLTSLDDFSFIKGGERVALSKADQPFDWDTAAGVVRGQLSDALTARNLAFLFGSGCSSFMSEGKQVGIPTMAPIATAFLKEVGPTDESPFVSAAERKWLKDWLGLDIQAEQFARNLERLMESLYGARFVLAGTKEENPAKLLEVVSRVIQKVSRHVLTSCTTGPFANGDDTVLNIYQAFYQKLLMRDRTLPRPWIFTTNYDLFNERAMDRRGIPYCNGFSGVIERRFNPAVFRYALAEQLDITSRKWTAVDSFVYLCKLHGSLNWIEDGETLFPVRELASTPTADTDRVLIYPTPAKQSASFASPYADLFREFQARIVRDQSVLVTVGYSFGDQHINNIIFQALTIPNFRLIAFVPNDAEGVIGQLRALADPRIWMIGGDGMLSLRPAHYFDAFVQSFMPELPSNRIEDAVSKVVKSFVTPPSTDAGNGADDGF